MNMNKIEAVVFDWAGTMIDYGCFAPLEAFLEIFRKRQVTITVDEAREPMGMLKIEHIRSLCAMPRIRTEWIRVHGTEPTEKDIIEMNDDFESILFSLLPDFTSPIPGAIELVERLREKGIKIGSTTGYTKAMMEIVAPRAKQNGYAPDCYFTADDVKAGRPFPWMCYANATELNVYPMNRMIKVGDTTTDMKEGKNAGMWTVGVVLGSSELALSEDEVKQMTETELQQRMETVRKRLFGAGADFVIDCISDLDQIIEQLEQ
ncbi:phosphonoacetaldehyde hydrolase [Peribacillus asahii]|uniref:Phosphonoacetaldehyde hydrolase n=1 Tax=Peribacillus asahii TaxID=228899 RepID=A0A3Q9RLY2_9BACI|nr:phosphonoacetaldehyde hydrolase [Peribacillus asahii]AZV42659.1 phosphonoacetaldehyde hydrolase [Peribacillus asahii]USK86924.1 phosphonoacetaldehyde hydrolase [Peribacillus asahii]